MPNWLPKNVLESIENLDLFCLALVKELPNSKELELAELFIDGKIQKKRIEGIYHSLLLDFEAEDDPDIQYDLWACACMYRQLLRKNKLKYAFLTTQAVVQASVCMKKNNKIYKSFTHPVCHDWYTPTVLNYIDLWLTEPNTFWLQLLADALEDVDCDRWWLDFLRSPGPFYKGMRILCVPK